MVGHYDVIFQRHYKSFKIFTTNIKKILTEHFVILHELADDLLLAGDVVAVHLAVDVGGHGEQGHQANTT